MRWRFGAWLAAALLANMGSVALAPNGAQAQTKGAAPSDPALIEKIRASNA